MTFQQFFFCIILVWIDWIIADNCLLRSLHMEAIQLLLYNRQLRSAETAIIANFQFWDKSFAIICF